MRTGQEETAIADLQTAVAPLLEGSPELQAWCKKQTVARYLRARNGDGGKALHMLKQTLQWRASYRPDRITWEDVAEEARTGKQTLTDHRDGDGCIVLVMRPRLENTRSADGQVRFLVYTLELASGLADREGNGRTTWIIDFEGYTLRNAPSLKVASATLHILQSHYPERLGRAVCFRAPALFSLTWKALQPFIDPRTARKIVFVGRGVADEGRAGVPPGTLAACGVGAPGWAFDAAAYAAVCRALEAPADAPARPAG